MNSLFTAKRFLPLFITQFLGAFNDNLFKNALVILATYKIATSSSDAAHMTNLAFGLFILPSFLLSSLAGQLADKIDRARIARITKGVEIALSIAGGAGLYFANIPLLLVTLFGFGVHAAFFGPVKYAVLPQHLEEKELMAANGYIEAGTFLAILSGTIIGGLVILLDGGSLWLTVLMVLCAVSGYLASRHIPEAPAPVPQLKISFNIWQETLAMVGQCRKQPDVYKSILGISWFWFVGAIFLAQFSPFAKDVLRADEHVVTLFLAIFSVGIAIGSVICGKVLKGAARATYVPLAAIGLSLFAFDLYAASGHVIVQADGELMSLTGFLQQPLGQRIIFDLLGIAICGGLYIVPLYAIVQQRIDKDYRARAIAVNNLMNALFMVGSAAMAMLMVALGASIPQIFLVTAILNTVVAMYICQLLPLSLIAAALKFLYRVEVKGLENYYAAGKRVLIVANHTSFLDAALLAAFLPERVTFAIHTFIARAWWIKPALKLVDTFAIDPTNPLATKSLIDVLKKDRKVMIFPEGRITVTGSLMKIFEGPGMIADKSGAVILPVRIDGAIRSPFSFMKGKLRIEMFPKVTLTILPPRQFTLPEDVMGKKRRQLAGAQLYKLMTDMMFDSSPVQTTLMEALLDAKRVHGGKHIIIEDQNRQPMNYGNFISKSIVLGKRIERHVSKNERRIGILLPNMVATAITFFGVQSIGRVTAMLNFSASLAQLSSACKAADLKTIITSKRFIEMGKLSTTLDGLCAQGIKILYLEDLKNKTTLSDVLSGLLASLVPEKLIRKAQTDDAAVMLFTSGSEGNPKGVQLSHRNILSNRYQLGSVIDFGPQDIVFNCLPMFHAFGLTGGTLLPLLAGIRTFFYPSPLHYRIVPALVYDSNATILFGTDTFLSGYARFADPYDFYSLRYVFAGAERVKDETRRVWSDKFGLRILEGYGATETSPVISVNTAMHYRAGTVGRIIPGIEIKLVSVPGIENGQQLHIKGPNVMMGYMKDTAPGILHPLEGGWYDTGDIVSVDADGYVTIKGRTKRFAKIGGEMVSLTAVEMVINKTWPDKNHAVVSIPDARKGEALILLTDYAAADLSLLTKAFRENGLTELSLPKKLMIMNKLPLLGTGKTDYVTARKMALEQERG